MKPDHVTNTPEDAALYEQHRGSDEWAGYQPARGEREADDFDDWAWWGERTAARPDPWACGPVHHPTRFDLPIPAEPPF